MKKKEPTITKNSRFSVSQAEKLSEYVEKYSYENDSEFIRIAVILLMRYHDYQDKFEDPNERMKFAQEIDPIIQTEKKQECMESLLINSSDKDLERFYFVVSQERNKRVKDEIKSKRDKMHILGCGGEIEPKVGYTLSISNDVEFYMPILPHNHEWEELSKDDKGNLLLELKQKLEDLENSEIRKDCPKEERFSRLKKIIGDISDKISDEE